MATTEGRIACALEEATEELEFNLDAASVEFSIIDSPNTNQYIIVLADGKFDAYVTAELSWDDEPMVFVDIYDVNNFGEERWVHGNLTPSEAVPCIIRMLDDATGEEGK